MMETRTKGKAADDGPGVAAENRERIFERFFRAPDMMGVEGFGLGLSVVAAAVRHHATIRLEEASPGLRVMVRFPPEP